jgi:hypothetical protein
MWSSKLFLKKLHSDVGSLHVNRCISFVYCVFSFSFCFLVFVIQYSSLHFDRFMHGSFILVSHHLFLTLYFLACEFHSCFYWGWVCGSLFHLFTSNFFFECVFKSSGCVLGVAAFRLFSQPIIFVFFHVSCTEPCIFVHLPCIMIHIYHHYPGILAMCFISFALFIFDPKFHVWFHLSILSITFFFRHSHNSYTLSAAIYHFSIHFGYFLTCCLVLYLATTFYDTLPCDHGLHTLCL